MTLVAAQAFGLELTEWVLIAALIAGILEVAGLSRSSRTLRKENADLRERNATLESEDRLREQRLRALELANEELKAKSVDALFLAFRDHDERMNTANGGMISALSNLAQGIAQHEDQAIERHEAMLSALAGIVQVLKSSINGGTE